MWIELFLICMLLLCLLLLLYLYSVQIINDFQRTRTVLLSVTPDVAGTVIKLITRTYSYLSLSIYRVEAIVEQ